MSLAVYFSKKCIDATKKNIQNVIKKFSEPMDLFTFDISGALKDAMAGGLGSSWAYAKDYLSNNADVLAYSMAAPIGKSLGLDVNNALNQVFSMLAFAQMAENNFVLYMMKYVAKNCVKKLDSKAKILAELKDLFTELYNQALIMTSGDPVYEGYLNNIRIALLELVSAKNDLTAVYNSLNTTSFFLSKVYERAMVKTTAAQHRLRPSTGGNPFITPFYDKNRSTASALEKTGHQLLTTTTKYPSKEQIDAMRAIPRISIQIIKSMRDYATTLTIINGLLDVYEGGVALLSKEMNNKIRELALNSIARMIQQLNSLNKNIAQTLKKRPDPRYPNDRAKAKNVSPVTITASAFKWTAQVSALISQMQLLPRDALTRMNLNQIDLNAYEDSVKTLKSMDTIKAGKAILPATDAKESITSMEQQVLLALTATNTAIPTGSINEQTYSLIKAILARIELTIQRDRDIKSTLNGFINHKLESEALFERIMGQVEDAMQKAGLDKALDLFKTGDFASFFGLTGQTATYIGAAMAAIALLKQCFDTAEQQEELTQIERELERDLDLINIKLNFDFDLAIFENLQLCLRVEGLSDLFNIKEFLCGLVDSKKSGSIFNALADAITSEREDYDSDYKEIAQGQQSQDAASSTSDKVFFEEEKEQFQGLDKDVKLDIIDGFKTWLGLDVAEKSIAANTPKGL
jgi:hypothetical protein